MHAGIVGAGIIGRLVAFELVNRGWQVSLFDQDDIAEATNNCSMVAAGLLTPITELDTAETIIHTMGAIALNQEWPRILSQLDSEIYFRHQGSIATAFASDYSELIRLVQHVAHKLPQQISNYALNANQLAEIEPELNHLQHAYFFPKEGQIDNQAVMLALTHFLIRQKVKLFPQTFVSEVTAYEIKMQGHSARFDVVIDCRGLGGKTFFPELRGVRGELIWLHAPEVKISHPVRVLHPRYKIYVAPRPQQIYVIGATEIESEDQSAISVRSLLELLSATYNLHPGFREARVIKTLTQCRPTLLDNLPQIKFKPGLVAINGLYRHGFLVAPVICHEVAQAITGEFTTMDYPQLWQDIT